MSAAYQSSAYHEPMHRRALLTLPLALAAQPITPRIDTHVHLFAADTKKFPFHPNATYQPKPATLEDYSLFVKQANIAHAVIVHPEPYQDDHSYLEHCFANEPSKDFFKGTCLFDAYVTDTPNRIDILNKKWPKRIRVLRIHRLASATQTSGPIRERPLDSSEMRNTWRAIASRGLMIQMHFIPLHAPAIQKLATEFKSVKVILDHLGRNNQGTDAEWRQVLNLAKSPNTIMKFSGLEYSPNNLEARVKQVFEAFGPDRIVWGGLGMDLPSFQKANADLDRLFAFTTEANRNKIRGLNAKQLYGWS